MKNKNMYGEIVIMKRIKIYKINPPSLRGGDYRKHLLTE